MTTSVLSGIMRELSMLNKTSNIMKYSFLAASLTYLLSSSALAQKALPLPNNEEMVSSNVEIAIDNSDELGEKSKEAKKDQNTSENTKKDNTKDNTENIPQKKDALLTPSNKKGSLQVGAPEENGNTENSQSVEENRLLKAYNNLADENDRRLLGTPQTPEDTSSFSDKIMNQVKEDLFSQMADIEKQTSLLTLELKREKIKQEIAAIRAQHQKALEEEQEKIRERERKQVEWEKEQERKLLIEQQKIKEMEIQYEKLRQERVLKAYKETMLKNNQEWIEYNARLYDQLVKEENAQNELIAKQKKYSSELVALVEKINATAQVVKEKYKRDVANLQTEIALLKSKLEAQKIACEENIKQIQGGKGTVSSTNPFALVSDDKASKRKIAEEYAIMEISGKGDVLVAKLINKNGGTFMVKPGTILNTGHVIEEITQTYIVADKSGIKDYLYFSAGGILDKEPAKPLNGIPMEEEVVKSYTPSEIPGLRKGMFVE